MLAHIPGGNLKFPWRGIMFNHSNKVMKKKHSKIEPDHD